jgi:hypothetical protein
VVSADFRPFVRFPLRVLVKAVLRVLLEVLHVCDSARNPVVIVTEEGVEIGV